MRIKRTISALLCIMMLITSVPAMSFSSGAASYVGAGGVCFSVRADGNTFTITRSADGALPRQSVLLRTVNGTAVGGIHYTSVNERMTFDYNETSRTYTVSEKTSAKISTVVDRYQTGTTRNYSFEVTDLDGYLLASTTRTITYDSSYKFNNEWIMEHDGEFLVFLNKGLYREDGYPPELYPNDKYVDVSFPGTSDYVFIEDWDGNGYKENGVWTASTDALFARSGTAPREYLSAVGDTMYATITFTGQEIDDGYQYIQVLADNSTTCDDGNQCKDPDGGVYNPSLSFYKACFEINEDSGNHPNSSVEAVQMFPTRSTEWISYDEGNHKYEINSYSKIYEQKFRSDVSCAGNAGAFMLDPTVGSLSVRFNARGKNDDDWHFKNLKMRLALVDVKAPTLLDYQISPGLNKQHNQITVTLRFSEIVYPKSGNLVLRTSWGNLKSQALNSSTYSNVISFTGEILANPGTGLTINSLEGTVVDLHGKEFGSLRKIDLSGVKVADYTTPTVRSDGSYAIACQSDLWWFAEYLTNNPSVPATLVSDLNMFSSSSGTFCSMSQGVGYSSTFEGGGNEIYNLTVNQGTNSSYVGLFAIVITGSTPGVVRNLTLDSSCYISAKDPSLVGGIAGMNSGTIEKCVVECIVSAGNRSADGSGKYVGGIAGFNRGTVKNCLVGSDVLQASISNYWSNMTVGGIVGNNSGTLASSMFYGYYNERSYTNITRGSVCGINCGSVTNCAGLHNDNNYFSSAVGALGAGNRETDAKFPDSPAFFSGEICYYLNGGVTDGTQAWYQTTGSGSLPSFTGDTVYMHGDSYANSNTHDWQVYYDWAWDDENGRYNVTATSVCLVGQETFTVTEAAVRVDHRDTTCVLKGYDRYLASFEGCEEYGMSQIFRTDYSDALGHDFVETVIEPDCTNRGYTIHKCSRCREVYNDTYVDALGHDFGEWTVTTEPGCTSKGEETRYCSRCDATETREVEAYGHDYEAAVTEPTCTAQGFTTYTCTRCGDSYTDTPTDALGHNFEKIKTIDPTCTTDGYSVYKCSRCPDSYNDDFTDALGHDSVDTVIEPDCTEQGYTRHKCSRCGEVYNDTYVDALGHDLIHYDAIEPTCTEFGMIEFYMCNRCRNFYTDAAAQHEISWQDVNLYPVEHDMTHYTAKDPTCTESGRTEYYFCERCGRYYTDSIGFNETDADAVAIAPLGHDFGEWTQTTDPTCTEAGEETRYCSRCDATETREIASLGHDLIHYDAIEPTCTEFGMIEFYMCNRCGNFYTDAAAQHEISWQDVNLNPIEHDMTHYTAKDPTCTESGRTEYYFCERCGRYYTDCMGFNETDADAVMIPPLGHDFGEWTQTREPTCTEAGEETRYCSRCDATETREVEAYGHDYEAAVTEPTCTAQGFTTYFCTRCTDSYDDNYVDALGHDFGGWVLTTEPTCTEAGEETRYCSRCNATETREVAAYGHDYEAAVTEPTCTAQGFTTYFCTRCTDIYDDNYVDALGHDFGEWTVTTEPGCTTKGEETRYCSRCDATETREAEALGHDLEHVEAKAATETECGNIEYWHCTVCGKYFSDENGRNEITEEETVIPKISQIVVGDVNGDGLITIRDLSDMKRLIAGAGDESEFVLANCDINGDGLLTIQDIAELKKLLA